MFAVEVYWGGRWSVLVRCVVPRDNRADFMSTTDSLAVLARLRERMSYPLRLTRCGVATDH